MKTDFLRFFFHELHPLISSPYILITHNSDYPIPNEFAHMLEDDKLIAWFGQNAQRDFHSKLHPIPIGIANRYWPHGNIELFESVRNQELVGIKDTLLYMNFTIHTYYPERSKVYEHFICEPFCEYSSTKDMHSYLIDLKKSKFVLSPRGNGLDCHRTWESLYMGAIPIVRTSALDSMYEGLPVLIVNDWNEVTQDFLEQKYEEMIKKQYTWKKLYSSYWFHLIDSYKKK